MKKKPGDKTFWMRTAAATAVLSIGLVAVVFQFSGSGERDSRAGTAASELRSGEKAATIQVTEGSGWLSTGEELQIAEWYSGSDRGEGEYFANFRGSDGGATVDLRLAGLNRSGTFACADPERRASTGAAAYVELRVDVENTYRSGLASGTCKVTVTRLDGEVMEGHYSATLLNSADAADDVTITGSFRATRPRLERLSGRDAGVIQLAAAP
ncbi:MAG: hypothetical protein K0Q91_1994 [Fibrobacteria bacterium]|jgi:hypothetical protein|nr:hypothetical protein [Fibrobacteria bacterium]